MNVILKKDEKKRPGFLSNTSVIFTKLVDCKKLNEYIIKEIPLIYIYEQEILILIPTNGVNKFTQSIHKNDETSISHSESQGNKIGTQEKSENKPQQKC